MNKNGKTKKTSISQGVLFLQRHPALFLFGVVGCFLIVPNSSSVMAASWWDTLTTPTAWLNALIYPFFLFFSWIVNLAAGIFVWVVDATTFTKLMNAGAIYEVWIVVRDFLNIFFILVLLFSAFATIFQLDKYEYKKTIPTLVIMALLVNFSFPIARFVIDLANVPLYFFAQNVFGTSGFNEITSGILSGTKMQNILIPGIDAKSLVDFQTTHLLAATICMFLFGISFLVLAILMLVRMIALAILVMFSPIGFVGMITPALSSFAKGWWDKLFKWAFYGPIAVMFVLVAVVVMKTAGSSIYPTSGAGGVFQSTGNSVNDNMVSAVAFFAIPIVLFWIAITSTEKYSNDISGLGIKWGSNLGRKAGNLVRRGAWNVTGGAAIGLTKYGWKQSGVPGGVKAWWNERTGWFSPKASERWREEAEAKRRALLPGGDKDAALKALERKRVNERVEENKKANKPYEILQEEMNKGVKSGASAADREKAAAAALTMADKEMFESSEDFKSALESVSGDMDSVTKIIRKAPKEMLRSGDDFVKALESVHEATKDMRPAAQAQIKNQLIDKAGSGALPITATQYEKILNSFKDKTGTIDNTLKGALESKMKKEGKIKALVDFEGMAPGMTRVAAIEKVMGEWNAENLGKQAGFMDDVDFRSFFRAKLRSGDFDTKDLEKYIQTYSGTGDRAGFKRAM